MTDVIAALERGRGRRARLVRSIAAAGVLAIAGAAVVGFTRGAPPPHMPDDKDFGIRVFDDQRPGCDCPYSACENGCVSQCSAHAYKNTGEIIGVNVEGQQSAVLSASTDGDTILYLTGRRCAIDRLMLARRRGAAYLAIDVTDQLDRKRVVIEEGCCTLAPDASSIVIPRADRFGFLRMHVTGFALSPPDPAGELDGILAERAPGVYVAHPALSADNLTLYYTVLDGRSPGDIGPLQGVYASTRSDARAPFPVGARLPGRARSYEYVSGVSEDGLTLFMTGEFVTHALVRARTNQPFGDPFENALPALMFGFRSIPVDGCKRIITTFTPGGCAAEHIVGLEPPP
jgi:hypothetical protein